MSTKKGKRGELCLRDTLCTIDDNDQLGGGEDTKHSTK